MRRTSLFGFVVGGLASKLTCQRVPDRVGIVVAPTESDPHCVLSVRQPKQEPGNEKEANDFLFEVPLVEVIKSAHRATSDKSSGGEQASCQADIIGRCHQASEYPKGGAAHLVWIVSVAAVQNVLSRREREFVRSNVGVGHFYFSVGDKRDALPQERAAPIIIRRGML